jgi:NADP-dependent 3-hydroxy acid dehydrogenase YdfG
MSNTNNSNNIPSTTTTTTEITTQNELDDLVSQLRQTINKTDWLVHNTSAKWEQENPELAKQWREAIKNNQTNDSTQQ